MGVFILNLMHRRWFPFIFQFASFLVFAILLIGGFLHKDFILLFIWKFWWPGLVVLTFFFGRLWCAACPMELMSNLAYRSGRAIGLKGINLPDWLKAGWLTLLFYLLLQFATHAFKVNAAPFYTSVLFSIFLSLAVISGFVFSHPRSFCAGFCPASMLLKNYSRITRLQLYTISLPACNNCREKYCLESCPSLLKPYERSLSDDCTLCFKCVKACPYDNLGFGMIKKGPWLAMFRPLLLSLALYVFIEGGFVLYELSEEVKWLEELHIGMPWFLLVFPFIFLSLLWAMSRFSKSRLGLSEFIKRLALIFLPVVASGHVAKAMIEINSSLKVLGGLLVVSSPLISICYFKKELGLEKLDLAAYSGIIIIVSLYLVSIISSL